MVELLATVADVDAVFAASDLMAVGALRALRAAGRAVPGDVLLLGFDDPAIARSSDPPLTTVRQPVTQFGEELARLLLAELDCRPSWWCVAPPGVDPSGDTVA